MKFEILETERLNLRIVTDEHYEKLLLHGSDNDIMNYLNIKAKEINKEKQKAVKGFSTFNKALLIFQLMDKQSNEILGWCGYHTWYKNHNRAEIGYEFTKESAKSKGLMTEALKQIIEYGFNKMKLNRIEAFVGPNNIPSLKIIQKFGFTKEGVLRSHYFKNEQFEDSIVFSLLSNEYIKNKF